MSPLYSAVPLTRPVHPLRCLRMICVGTSQVVRWSWRPSQLRAGRSPEREPLPTVCWQLDVWHPPPHGARTSVVTCRSQTPLVCMRTNEWFFLVVRTATGSGCLLTARSEKKRTLVHVCRLSRLDCRASMCCRPSLCFAVGPTGLGTHSNFACMFFFARQESRAAAAVHWVYTQDGRH